MTKILKIGTRGSNLALWQTRYVEKRLRALYPDLEIHIEIIKTKGDKILDQALSKIEGKGLFTKEIEDKLLSNEIDLAVHSLKDMPTELPEGLAYGAIPCREDPSDALFNKHGGAIADFPEGATVYTSSLRRKSQLLAARPDLNIEDVRGNVETRLMKYSQNKNVDGMVLASAGLIRLELDSLISCKLDPQVFIPACGQGAMAIEIRENDQEVLSLVKPMEDTNARLCTDAERSFLAGMGGGCQVPMGAYSWIDGENICIKAFSANVDGSEIKEVEYKDSKEKAKEVGNKAAELIKSK